MYTPSFPAGYGTMQGTEMAKSITNYDGSITITPQQLVYPETVEEIQAVLRTVLATPARCGRGELPLSYALRVLPERSVSMSHMNKVVAIDKGTDTFTAQAGLEFIRASDAACAIRNLQFMHQYRNREHDSGLGRVLP